MKKVTFPQEMINELQGFYNDRKVTMFQIIGCFTSAVAKQLNEKQMTMEERAEFFKSEEYNNSLNEFKSNFTF